MPVEHDGSVAARRPHEPPQRCRGPVVSWSGYWRHDRWRGGARPTSAVGPGLAGWAEPTPTDPRQPPLARAPAQSPQELEPPEPNQAAPQNRRLCTRSWRWHKVARAEQNDRSVRAACGTPSGPGEVQSGGSGSLPNHASSLRAAARRWSSMYVSLVRRGNGAR